MYSAFQDADVLIYMIEVGEKGLKDQKLFEKLKQTSTPVLMLLNKIDLAEQDFVAQEMERWSGEFTKC